MPMDMVKDFLLIHLEVEDYKAKELDKAQKKSGNKKW
tara:strand:+ start:363 stop:473 length:111 start_codon:yes stop_codon:yes gene_type:complete